MNRNISLLTQALTNAGSTFAPYGYSTGYATPSNLEGFISPVQFQRMSHDVKMWREAILEAELAFYPKRVRMQRMYMDTDQTGYFKALINRYRELTTLRDYEVFQKKDGKKIVSRDLTQALEGQSWLGDYIEEVVNATLYGYSLISLGDIVADSFPNLSSIVRENILPDGNGRQKGNPVLTSMVYMTDGVHIKNDPLIEMCNHWISTKPERRSSCGYGLLYVVALLEIHVRHASAWNVDYVESYGQPIKKGFTRKTGKERKKFEEFLKNSASNSYVLLDKATEDDVEYEMAAAAGTAWKSYDNLITRLEGTASQVLLGHTDSIKSLPGKLGGMQAANKDGFNESLVEQAMNAKQTVVGNFVCRKLNEVSFPLFRRLGRYVGSKIIQNLVPEGYQFGLVNDKEEQNIIRRKNAQTGVAADWAQKAYNAGLQVDPSEFSEWTGFTFTKVTPERKLLEERTIHEGNETDSEKADEIKYNKKPTERQLDNETI